MRNGGKKNKMYKRLNNSNKRNISKELVCWLKSKKKDPVLEEEREKRRATLMRYEDRQDLVNKGKRKRKMKLRKLLWAWDVKSRTSSQKRKILVKKETLEWMNKGKKD